MGSGLLDFSITEFLLLSLNYYEAYKKKPGKSEGTLLAYISVKDVDLNRKDQVVTMTHIFIIALRQT